MKITTYCIKHPIIALVLNAMIVVVGLMCFHKIPLREYPEIQFPVLSVQTQYPNASAELVESSVTNPLEDALAGIEGLDTIMSESSQGRNEITLQFHEGIKTDNAVMSVRDAINNVRSMLPKEVSEPNVMRNAQSDWLPFIVVSVSSEDLSIGELTHYANLYLKNALRSLKGVASADVWGQPYTMNIALDPKKMYAFSVDTNDIYSALEQADMELPVGKYRDEIPTNVDLKFSTAEEYDKLPIKVINNKIVTLKSIADTTLSSDDKQFRIRMNGKPALIIAVSKSSDANPLTVSQLVHDKIHYLQTLLPHGIKVDVALDQTQFIKKSLSNIQSSLIESVFLVLVIVFFFLRSLSATLIPLITIPISLMGGIILLWVFGYSLNVITLLAMVLAIGLVVDDAIVILENITRHIEKGESPYQAALKGSREIGFAIVAITLTLASVYIPIAFIDSILGQLFVEFAIVLAGTVIFSGIIALTLSPVMCAKLLNTQRRKRYFPQIDTFLHLLEKHYKYLLDILFCYPKIILVTACTLLIATLSIYGVMPQEVAPKEDRSLVNIFIPPIMGKDMSVLEKNVINIENKIKSLPEIKNYFSFMGHWGGMVCLPLKDIHERNRTPENLVAFLQDDLKETPSVDVWPSTVDTGLPGMQSSQGADLKMAITTIGNYRDLYTEVNATRQLIEDAKAFPYVWQDLNLDNPGYKIHLDNNRIASSGLTPLQIARMTEIFFSGQQYFSFEKEGLKYQISLIGNRKPWTLDELYVTSPQGKRISLGTLATLEPTTVPQSLQHFNQMRSTYLNVAVNPGEKLTSSMPKLLALTEKLPPEYKKEWMGSAKTYFESRYTMLLLFSMAIVFIYAILTMQFENFVDPLIIILTVPLACFGALFLGWVTGQSINIFSQIGLITLIGLITKHGILIVEFANKLYLNGKSYEIAVKEAALLRLRPILMTTAAMIIGSLPLVISTGAGAEARRAIGIFLVGGLIFGTAFTLLMLPKIYHMIKTIPNFMRHKISILPIQTIST